jgi:hypothetical protein
MYRHAVVGSLIVCATTAVSAVETITVDAALDRHGISPLIYGVAFASTAQLQALNAPSNRWGGNTTSRYNWQQNADNKGSDWYFESIDSGDGTAASASADAFIDRTRAAGADALITVPMLDWVAKLGAGRSKLASFSITKYGAQTDSDSAWMPDAGNGVRTAGGNVTGNDPSDANVASTPSLQADWVSHLRGKYGAADAGGIRYYLLDNEHTLWQSTHRDVHPAGAGMDELWSRMSSYAAAIKGADPAAKVIGPEEWGIAGTLLSGLDQSGPNWHHEAGSDAAAHGGLDYYPWLLQQFQAYDTAHGVRLLDVLTTHCYPTGNEYGGGTDAATQALRNRSTRALWDPAYVDESWVGRDTWPGLQIRMIPRLKEWVAANYPGTKVGITEYNWGAEDHINGATAQADIFGIFGREGLDLASRWTTPDPATPTFKAMQLYRNYDGAGSFFGDTSVRATCSADPDVLSVFAAERTSDGALTVMLINKSASSTSCDLGLAHASASTADLWQLTAANSITHLAAGSLSGNHLTLTLPAQSITLAVLPTTVAPTPALQLSTTTLTVTEGATATFQVRLTVSPAATTSVTVTHTSGDSDLSVSGGATLTFTTGNWNTWQTVTLAAASDRDTANSTANFAIAAAGLVTQNLTAQEFDTTTVTVSPSGSGSGGGGGGGCGVGTTLAGIFGLLAVGIARGVRDRWAARGRPPQG